MPCQERTQWAKEEANTNRGQRQHHAEFRTEWLKQQRGKDHACCLSVDKEVVVLDCGSGNRRKSNATILRLSSSSQEILQLLASVCIMKGTGQHVLVLLRCSSIFKHRIPKFPRQILLHQTIKTFRSFLPLPWFPSTCPLASNNAEKSRDLEFCKNLMVLPLLMNINQ